MSDGELELTLVLPDDGSTLRVFWSKADESWSWMVLSSQGQQIQGGANLQIATGRTAKDAIKVLIEFLLVAGDRPLPGFYDATHTWAATRRQALRDGRDIL
jgi:ABC-type uncharacterized transport system YnjBCD substrate-binding protein